MNQVLRQTQDSTVENLKRRFHLAATELRAIGQANNFRITPTTNPALPLFSVLLPRQQLQVVELLETSAQVYRELMHQNQNLRNSSSVTWMAFRTLGLVPPSNFFDKIGSDDVVQIYTKEGFHLFVNFRFFEVCSYTLEQVYSLPWEQLWHRDPESLAELKQIIGTANGPNQKEAIAFKLPPHRVVELASPFKYELNYSLRGIAPVWSREPQMGKVGFVIVEHAELVTEIAPHEEEQLLTHFYQEVENNL